jgi:hypothetical protein
LVDGTERRQGKTQVVTWPANFSPREWDCYDKRGTIGPKGALVAALPSSGRIHDNAKRCARNLQVLRDELGVSISVISGYRPPRYNRPIGGAKKSQHLTGRAADIRAKGVSTKKLHATVLRLIREGKMEQGGVGVYLRSKFVHYDVRGRAARWSQRT